MSCFEDLPAELHDMVLAQCSPRDLLALISASPTSLSWFNQTRHQILSFLWQAAESEVDQCAWNEALTATWLRLNQRQRPGTTTEHDLEVQALVQGYLAIKSDPLWYNRSHGDGIRDTCFNTLPFLVELFEVIAQADRLSPRFISYVTNNPIPSYYPISTSYTPDLPMTMHPYAYFDEVAVQDVLLRFEVYCRFIFNGNNALPQVAARYVAVFYKRFKDTEIFEEIERPYEEFHLVLNYLFQEHKTTFREVAKGLSVTPDPGLCKTPDATRKEEELRAAEALQRAAPAMPTDAIRKALQIQRLDKRRLAEEDGYCRYLVSFGIALAHRILHMTEAERQDFTPTEFSRFSLTQTPQSFFPPYHLGLGWGIPGTPRENGIPAQYSRVAFAAWFWDITRLAEVGSNTC